MLGVVDWYHGWLDRALDGDASSPFDPVEFEVRNQAEIDARRTIAAADVIERFEERAGSYLERALPHWELAYGFPLGTTTVGGHLAVAAAEWHLHAWDVTRETATPHVPESPDVVLLGAGNTIARVTGGIRGRLLATLLPLAARRDAWAGMLTRSGRDPAAAGPRAGTRLP